jgi:hypothetical protein
MIPSSFRSGRQPLHRLQTATLAKAAKGIPKLHAVFDARNKVQVPVGPFVHCMYLSIGQSFLSYKELIGLEMCRNL